MKTSGTADHLTPQHNELSLYLIGASMTALLLLDPVMRQELSVATRDRDLTALVPTCLIFFGQGILFTIIHLFTHSRKNAYEIFCMVFFAVFVNAVAGIAACAHIITENGVHLLLIFPIWNLFSSLVLMASLFIATVGGGDTRYLQVTVGEEDATPRQLILGTAILACLIWLCHLALHLHWSITLSICVIYASHFDRLAQKLAHSRQKP